MSKRFLTLVLVALLAMTCAFAYRGEIKIGISGGAGSDNVLFESSKGSVTGIVLGGNITGVFQYGLSDSSSVKLEVGLNAYDEAAIYVNDDKVATYEGINLDRDPNAVFYLGYAYSMPLFGDGFVEWEVGAGLQGMAGSCFTSNDFNLSLGLGLEETFIFNISDSFAITSSTRAGIQLLNTNKELVDYLSDGYRAIPVYFTSGVTYSF